MVPSPKVSVLMPLYRTPKDILKEAIESVLTQTYRNFELVVLDDSPAEDRRDAQVTGYNDVRIRYAANDHNVGISATRNKLLQMARGEYIAIMDHDDIMLPERLQKQTMYLDSHPEVGVLGGQVRYIPSGKTSCFPPEDREIRTELCYRCSLAHTAAMLRRDVLLSSGVHYEEKYSPAEDYALWLSLLDHTQLHNLSEVMMLYRVHTGNTSKLRRKAMESSAAALHALVKTTQPTLYAEYMERARRLIVIRIFGILPLLRIKGTRHNDTMRWDVRLFGCIPFIICKTKIRL